MSKKTNMETLAEFVLGLVFLIIFSGLLLSFGKGNMGEFAAYLIIAIVVGIICWSTVNNDKNTETDFAQKSRLEWKKCPKCKHKINKVAKKCPYCEYIF